MMDFSQFHFIRPYWLLAMLPALAVIVLLLKSKLSQGVWSNLCDNELLPYLLRTKNTKQSRGLLSIGSLAAVLVILALAGPTWQRIPSPVFRNASALVIALDLSRSMDAEDIKPSRLIRARYKIADILKQRKDGQTALLVYAGDAFTITPLTDDTETITNQLPVLSTDMMPDPSSNTVLALKKSVELFKQSGLQQGQIILITDEVDNDALVVAEALDAIQLSVLGVGTTEGAPIALPEGGFMKDAQGAIVIPKLNINKLKGLAQAGQGSYQTISPDDADIQALLAKVNQPLEQKADHQTDILLDQWQDKGSSLLLLVIPLAALIFRKGVLCLALLLLLPLPKNSYALAWQDLWQTKNQQAQQAFNDKQYEQAAKLFDNPDWKAAAHYQSGEYTKALENSLSPTSDGFYNQGNTLAKSGQLEKALNAYDKALKLNADNADAQFNKAVVEKALEKQKQQQEEQKKDDQQKADQNAKQQQNQSSSSSDSEASENDKKPEQKSERSSKEEEQPSSDKETEKEDAPQQQKQKTGQSEQNKATEQLQSKNAATPSQETPLSNEKQQANEQWLKRIPDDPGGLLRRKFLYQYGQHKHQPTNNGQAW